MDALFNTTLITNSFTGLTPVENNVYIYDNEFPLIVHVGSGRLFVDSVEYLGRLTYSPDADAWKKASLPKALLVSITSSDSSSIRLVIFFFAGVPTTSNGVIKWDAC